jgi:hypothetical protein
MNFKDHNFYVYGVSKQAQTKSKKKKLKYKKWKIHLWKIDLNSSDEIDCSYL